MIIGGEFEIDPGSLTKETCRNAINDNAISCYSSGRAALFQIVSFLKRTQSGERVLLPDYLCPSIVDTVKKVGFKYDFYSLTPLLEVDINTFSRHYNRGDIVLLINYFGLTSVQPQAELLKKSFPDLLIIEDDVQAFFPMFEEVKEHVDFCFTSLRKTFAIPDGGLVSGRHILPQAKDCNTFTQYKLVGSILKHARDKGYYDDQLYLNLLAAGESLIDENMDSVMSQPAHILYERVDFIKTKASRRDNAQYLSEGLKSMGINPLLPMDERAVPLFLPVCIDKRDQVRKYLSDHNVFCPVHWPLDGLDVRKGKELAECELSLIIDQRYGRGDMDRMLMLLDDIL